MKLQIKQEVFAKGVGVAERSVGKNLTLPVLNNILLRSTDGKTLEIIATDLETGVAITLPAKVEQKGSIILPPRILNSLLTNIPEGTVTAQVKNNTLFLEHGNYKTSLKGEDDKEFPLLPKINDDKTLILKTEEITEALQQVIHSVATSDLKPELTGVLLSVKKNEIVLASTDSFRLSEKKVSLKENKNTATGAHIIIPAQTVQEVLRSFKDMKGSLWLLFEPNQVVFQNEEDQKIHIKVISKTIEGDYPDYSQIIPQKFETKTVVSRRDLIQQIKAASIFSSRVNDITLSVQEKKIGIETENYDIGNFTSTVQASTVGEEKKLVFNHQYLLQGLQNIQGDEVIIKINEQDKPTIFESTDNKDFFYVLMPIRGKV